MKTRLISFLILAASIGFLTIGVNNAVFTSRSTVEDNQFSTGTWPVRHVVINEVYYDVSLGCGNEGSDANPDEWVELYNPSGSSVDLKNWTLTDNSSTTIIYSASKIIPASGFALISKDAKTWTIVVGCWNPPAGTLIVVTGQKIGNGLDNAGDRLILKDSTGAPIDAVSWGTDTSQLNPSEPTVADGHSIERSPLGIDTNTAADWSDNSAPSPGTP